MMQDPRCTFDFPSNICAVSLITNISTTTPSTNHPILHLDGHDRIPASVLLLPFYSPWSRRESPIEVCGGDRLPWDLSHDLKCTTEYLPNRCVVAEVDSKSHTLHLLVLLWSSWWGCVNARVDVKMLDWREEEHTKQRSERLGPCGCWQCRATPAADADHGFWKMSWAAAKTSARRRGRKEEEKERRPTR